MLILPQILHIFRTLPISLKSSHFKSLNALLQQFIWKSKRPTCSKTLLIKHRLAGGMGLIDLNDYFRASILNQLKNWITPLPDTLSIEQVLSPTLDLCSLLLLDIWKPLPLHQLPFTIQASLIAWRALYK